MCGLRVAPWRVSALKMIVERFVSCIAGRLFFSEDALCSPLHRLIVVLFQHAKSSDLQVKFFESTTRCLWFEWFEQQAETLQDWFRSCKAFFALLLDSIVNPLIYGRMAEVNFCFDQPLNGTKPKKYIYMYSTWVGQACIKINDCWKNKFCNVYVLTQIFYLCAKLNCTPVGWQ